MLQSHLFWDITLNYNYRITPKEEQKQSALFLVAEIWNVDYLINIYVIAYI
jgi:hypothetical protein